MSLGKATFYPNMIQYVGYTASGEPSIAGEGYTCSGAETSGAAYDLLDNKRTATVSIDSAGESTNPIIDIDLTSNITTADFCIVDNHNLYSCGAQWKARDGTPSDIALSYAYHGTLGNAMTNNASTPLAVPTSGSNISLMIFSSAQTKANFDLRFEPIVAVYGADMTIGEIAIGKYYQISVAPDANPDIISNFTGVSKLTTPGGQKYGFGTYGERRAWNLSWSFLNATDYASLLAVWQYTKGGLYPMYVDLGEAATPALYYVRFADNSLRFRKLAAEAYEVSVLIESEV